ncbi:hypothetical protein ACF1BU_38560 [Streptomyces sp. NPDC014724]|uniref:hypothetical protein n=1 Tax=unclassified Streptomyces TaxID=2593676 RepID=UPI0036F7F49A
MATDETTDMRALAARTNQLYVDLWVQSERSWPRHDDFGMLILEVAPAYLSDHQATDTLTLPCDEFNLDLDHGLAGRRYALTSDRRALHGTVL